MKVEAWVFGILTRVRAGRHADLLADVGGPDRHHRTGDDVLPVAAGGVLPERHRPPDGRPAGGPQGSRDRRGSR